MRAIIYAMQKEITAPFVLGEPLPAKAGLALYQVKDDLLICQCGIGKVNAALAAQYLIDCWDVTELWNAGVSGCFRDDPAGTLLAIRSCVQHDMDIFCDPPGQVPTLELVHLPCDDADTALNMLKSAGLPCRLGVVATGDWFQRDYDRAAHIRDHFGADVCDMEAGAIAQICLRNHIPFHCLKVVSDHLFHPSQYEEYEANLPLAAAQLNEALSLLIGGN